MFGISFGPKGPFCQSCGMPMAKDKQGGGSEADGSRSMTYCSFCYQNGAFTEPDLTVEKMQAKVAAMLKNDMHLPGFISYNFTKTIPSLKRWRQG